MKDVIIKLEPCNKKVGEESGVIPYSLKITGRKIETFQRINILSILPRLDPPGLIVMPTGQGMTWFPTSSFWC